MNVNEWNEIVEINFFIFDDDVSVLLIVIAIAERYRHLRLVSYLSFLDKIFDIR